MEIQKFLFGFAEELATPPSSAGGIPPPQNRIRDLLAPKAAEPPLSALSSMCLPVRCSASTGFGEQSDPPATSSADVPALSAERMAGTNSSDSGSSSSSSSAGSSNQCQPHVCEGARDDDALSLWSLPVLDEAQTQQSAPSSPEAVVDLPPMASQAQEGNSSDLHDGLLFCEPPARELSAVAKAALDLPWSLPDGLIVSGGLDMHDAVVRGQPRSVAHWAVPLHKSLSHIRACLEKGGLSRRITLESLCSGTGSESVGIEVPLSQFLPILPGFLWMGVWSP